MISILPIVEGHGEVGAVPILIRRLAERYAPAIPVNVLRPIRTSRSSLVQPDGVERVVELAARQTGPSDGILLLLDADDDCPRELAETLRRRAERRRSDRNIRVVAAKREFEAWYLAGAESLRGKRGLSATLTAPPDPEGVRDAKGWLSRHTAGSQTYKPTIDQPALAQLVDLDQAGSARSFRKFAKDVRSLLGAERGRL